MLKLKNTLTTTRSQLCMSTDGVNVMERLSQQNFIEIFIKHSNAFITLQRNYSICQRNVFLHKNRE